MGSLLPPPGVGGVIISFHPTPYTGMAPQKTKNECQGCLLVGESLQPSTGVGGVMIPSHNTCPFYRCMPHPKTGVGDDFF